MATVQDCTNNINKYNALKDNIYVIINHLNNANDYSFKAKNQLDGVYTINDSNTNIYSRIKLLSENINSTSNYLKNTIIPAIDNAINGLNNQIKAIQEEERRRAEEAARQERERQAQLARERELEQQRLEQQRLEEQRLEAERQQEEKRLQLQRQQEINQKKLASQKKKQQARGMRNLRE